MAKHAKAPALNVVTPPESRLDEAAPDEARIAALAYGLWLGRGCPNGSDQEDWFRAEEMVKSGVERTAKLAAAE